MAIPENVKKIFLRIMSVLLLMEMLDATILNTALPQIAKSLHANPIQLKEILTVYFLSLGVFIPVSGWAADRFGERKALLFAILLFTLSSIACGLATNLPILTICRLLQGIGGAFLMPVGRQVIIRSYAGIDRTKAMANINVLTYLGLLLGPLIGGMISTYTNWRWIFFVNVPMGVLGFYLIYKHLPMIREQVKAKFDLPGFLLIGVALGCGLFLIDILIDLRTPIYLKLILLVIATITFTSYIIYARHAANPIINLSLFRDPEFSAASLGNFLARLTMTAHPFLLPLLLQTAYGMNAVQSGLFTLPALAGTLSMLFLLTRLLKRYQHQRLLMLNSIVLLALFCSYFLQTIHLMIPLLLVQQAALGFISALQTALMNSNAYEHLSETHASQGISVNSGIIQVSGSFGIALAALAMIAVIGPNDLQHTVPMIAFKTVFIVQSLYLLAALWFFRPHSSLKTARVVS